MKTFNIRNSVLLVSSWEQIINLSGFVGLLEGSSEQLIKALFFNMNPVSIRSDVFKNRKHTDSEAPN